MATLKDHQQAMVDLLASGSGIPASASRLAHAMHDVLEVLQGTAAGGKLAMGDIVRFECTTPGLNDKALARDLDACRIVLTGNGGGPKSTPAERRVKELEETIEHLENTVEQLTFYNAKLLTVNTSLREVCDNTTIELRDALDQLCWYKNPEIQPDPKANKHEQAGCRKDDTQVCDHEWHDLSILGGPIEERCVRCGVLHQ